MTTERISPPAALAVSMVEAKETLRIDEDDTSMDATITLWIKGITAQAEHATGRAFINRAMRTTLDQFPDAIRLGAPSFSVEAVRFIDPDGQMQTLDPADYYVDKVTKPAYIVPASGKAWPATASRVHTVFVDHTDGYGLDYTTVPEEAQNYILAKLLVQYGPPAAGGGSVGKPFNVDYIDGLLDSLKVYG